MENFSQIMDPDYASMAYQNETNIGEMLTPPVNTNLTDPQANIEPFPTLSSSSDVNESTHIPEQIFEEAESAATQPVSDEMQIAPDTVQTNTIDAIDSTDTAVTNTIDAIDSIDTVQMESATNQNEVTDASQSNPPTTEAAITDEANVPKNEDGEKKDEESGDKEKEQDDNMDDSPSLMVPDEKTKRKDAVEEEINKNQCRICLSTDNLVDIYKSYDEQLQICDLVTKLCPTLRIHERDYLPQFVCDVCEDRLHKAYELKLQCEATDRELRSKLPRRKLKARSATEFVMIDCNELSSGSDDEDKDQEDDDEFHLSEEISSSSELDSDASSEEEVKKRPPPKRARRQPPPPPPKRQVITVVPHINKAPTTSKKVSPVATTIGNIKVERIDANRTPVKRVQHFQCSICRKTFTDQTVFSSHVQMHRDEKERTCVQCKHKFMSIPELQKHMKLHHNKPSRPSVPSNNVNMKRRTEPDPPSGNGERDLFKTVAPLTTTYWSDSFSD